MNRPYSGRDCCALTQALSVLLASALFACLGPMPAVAMTTYHVGNSLTFDSRIITGHGAHTMALEAGLTWNTGWQINCGASLEQIIDNPDGNCVAPSEFGKYYNALPNLSWDAITLQPFSGTPIGEYQAAKQMIQMASDPGIVYIYESWPALSATQPLYAVWGDTTPVSPDDVFTRIDGQFDWVLNQLRGDTELTGSDIRVVPAVQALAEFEQLMLTGQVPGLTETAQLYRDTLHLNNLGRFIVANTMVATLFGRSTVGFPMNSDFELSGGTGPVTITPEIALLAQQVVWDVVSNHPDTGVIAGDLNNNGYVGIDDLNTVLSAWSTSIPQASDADPTGDGFVGIEDLNRVLSNWNTGTPPAIDLTNIPEPASLPILAVCVSAYLNVHRKGKRQTHFYKSGSQRIDPHHHDR